MVRGHAKRPAFKAILAIVITGLVSAFPTIPVAVLGLGLVCVPVAAASADAPRVPPTVEAAAVFRVDLFAVVASSDQPVAANWLPVFPRTDAPLMAEMLDLYQAARADVKEGPSAKNLGIWGSGPEAVVYLGDGTEVRLLRVDAGRVRVAWTPPEASDQRTGALNRRGAGAGGVEWVIGGPALAGWLEKAPSRFVPDTAVLLDPGSDLVMGETLTINCGWVDPWVDAVRIYLIPGGGGAGATDPDWPEPGAALIAELRPGEEPCRYTLRLEGEVGRLQDGSTLRVRPGSYAVLLRRGAGDEGWFITIAAREGKPRVVAVRGGRVVVWTPGEPLARSYLLPWSRPIQVGDYAFPDLEVPVRFMRFFGFRVRSAGKSATLTGEDDIEIALEAGENFALVNGTKMWFAGRNIYTARRSATGIRAALFTPAITMCLKYRVYCPAPGEFIFVRGAPGVPREVLEALGYLRPRRSQGGSPGVPALVLANGIPVAGEVVEENGVSYVPALAFAHACRGQVGPDCGLPPEECSILQVSGDFGWIACDGLRLSVRHYDEPTEPEARRMGLAVERDVQVSVDALVRGTTLYLPLEAMATALDAEVKWEVESGVMEIWFPTDHPANSLNRDGN